MSKFFDNTVYPLTSALNGEEIFIIYQNGESRTTDFDKVVSDVMQPLVDNMLLDDISNVTITNKQNGQVLMYMNGVWVNSNIDHGYLNDINDVTISSVVEGQMLLWSGTEWVNGYDPTLKGYIESEYNLGTQTGNCNLSLTNGNVQRLRVSAGLNIILPSLPPSGNNWNLTLKVESDGINLPSYAASGATLKWNKNDVPNTVIGDGRVAVYVFTSDSDSSSVYGSLVWSEE